ncbi:Tad domain-containing protein [Noviherbaspirillum sp. 1P10PC]|uniref:pilus assembly protein TadG-related protein n=1 Tax=Noviherbaspirillum sp. 1P10PC TaxID=3132292 RepID=UPI0039A2284B
MERLSFHWTRQGGAVAIIAALALPILIGFAGLALDLGHMYIEKTELQNATDACALAASRELTCDPAAGPCPSSYLEAAVNSGLTVARRNRIDFQGNQISNAQISASDIKFSLTIAPNSAYLDKDAANPASKYVMCTAYQTGIIPWFMRILGIGEQSVSAQAVATLVAAQSNCAIPLGVCLASGGSATNPYAGFSVGQWLTSRMSSSSTGSFDWIDYTPASGGGASELADMLTGTGQCNLPPTGPATCSSGGAGTPGCVGAQGNKNALGKAWNTRFGLYKGSNTAANAPPDYTGYAYTPTSWPSRTDAFSNFQSARAAFTPFQGETAAGLPRNALNGYSTALSTTLSTSGADRRLAVAPIVDCSSWAGSSPQTVPILGYACVLMLHPMSSDNGPSGTEEVFLEYRGRSTDPGSPCATSGMVGGPGSVGPLVPALVQ